MLHLVLLFLAIASCSQASPLILRDQGNEGIQLPSGRYVGAHDANTSTTTYYAIPYAYSSRFEPSQLIDTSQNLNADALINATTHGPGCVNFNLPPPYDEGFSALLGPNPIKPCSEDCLTIDVYVPDGDYTDLPVVVYTPGGGFLVGASFPYDMRPLVSRSALNEQPIVAVVINYRLGPLGFLNPSIWGPDKINIGLLDQVNALRYVKKYISAFGGSPDKVTIMGESAGGESTMHQMLWTEEDFFRSVWIMSVAISAPFLAQQPSNKDDTVKAYGKACGCTSNNLDDIVDCLRGTSVQTLTNHSAEWQGSGTSLGGSYVRRNVFDTIRDGQFPQVPVVFSACRDEGTPAAYGYKPNSTEITSIAIENLSNGRGLKGQQAAQFKSKMLAAYPNDPAVGCPFDGANTTYGQPSQFKRMAAIFTDGTYAEPWTEFLETFSSKTNTWGMSFQQPIRGSAPEFGVQHGSDVVYYFPTLSGPENDPRSFGQEDLVNSIHDALINFINDGDPNGLSPQDPEPYHWPLYSEAGKVTALNASELVQAIPPPHRPGFDVLHHFLRPGPLRIAGKRQEPQTAALNLQA